jgi:integration host factor subunit alpha
MAVTKAELAEYLFNVMGINKREAKDVIDLLFEEICLALEQGDNVKLSGFGIFLLRDKRQRPGRNPKTGKEVLIKPRRVVTFRAGEKLKAKVESYAGSGQERETDQ